MEQLKTSNLLITVFKIFNYQLKCEIFTQIERFNYLY